MSTASGPGSSPVLPEGVREEQLHGTDALVVETGAARATIYLHGAHLAGWRPTGEADLLWVSPLSGYGEGHAIRGGIPLIGPWFGPGRDGAATPKHGWLRTSRWELAGAEAEGDDVVLAFALEGADPAGTGMSARARMRIGTELEVELTVRAGSEPLELEAALHSYLAVADVRQVGIDGLSGIDYLDNTRGLAPDRQTEPFLVPHDSTDRVYDTGSAVLIHDRLGERTIRAVPRGTTKTVVWNPWDELAANIADLPDDSWPRFVCVEPAVAKDGFVPLEPGESHTIAITYRIEH